MPPAVLLAFFFLLVSCSISPEATIVDITDEVLPGDSRSPAPPCPLSGTEARKYGGPPPMVVDADKEYTATLRTNKGDIVIELLAGEAPLTVNNFVFLAQDGFYDCVPFHRVLEGFMVQTGDPTGTGAGGPGYRFADERVTREYTAGVVAMANAGPNTNGSQFFIMHADAPQLPKSYTIFGQVRRGMNVVNAIATAPVTASAQGERSRPKVQLYVASVKIAESSP